MPDPEETERAFSDWWFSQTDYRPDDPAHVHYNAPEISEDRLTFTAGWNAALAARSLSESGVLSAEQVAELWDFDISQKWVRIRLAERITEAGYAVAARRLSESEIRREPISDAEVEAAAHAMFEPKGSVGEYTWAEMVSEDQSRADLWRADARAVLEAARATKEADRGDNK